MSRSIDGKLVLNLHLGRIPRTSKFSTIWKGIAKGLASQCKKCGQPRLYSVFDAYMSGDQPDCLGSMTNEELDEYLTRKLKAPVILTPKQ